MLAADRWERAKELFEGALRVATDRRATFLAEGSGGDETLRLEVESLLASHEQAGAFLGESEEREGAAPGPGGRVGPYRLLGLLGRGGMGDVYRAVRDDDHFKKIVAVKLVRPDLAGGLEESRLRAERQILACLEHPGIARLLDGGATEDGRPFLVMEHVDGTRLDAFAEERGLDTRARVALFRTACAAVQHAHQNLVVHRDLKPANILVTAEGVPKLLDFGIAKLLDPAHAGDWTTTAFPAMTPAYASPEQVRGEPITTATDVYSLGAVLYELVAGVRPHRGTGSALTAAICEQVPERPSLAARTLSGAATTRRVARAVGSDLDAIVLKALRKEPARRYATVEALSEDLRRYLDGLPVTAAKGTLLYRAGKLVRRNRAAVALASTLLALLIAFAAHNAAQARRLARERDRAARVTSFMENLFRVSEPSEARGNTITAREMLDRGTAQIESELKDEPEVRAALLDALGRAYMSLGLHDKAGPLLERGVALRRGARGTDEVELAASLDMLGIARSMKGDYAAAEALHREALALRRRRLGPDHVRYAESLTHLGTALRARRPDSPEAEALFREAIAAKRRTLGPDDANLANPMNELAFVLRDKGDLDGAEALLREAIGIWRKSGTDALPQFAAFLNSLAVVLKRKGDYEGADAYFRESLAVKRTLYGSEHPSLAVALANLGGVARDRGDHAAAEALQRDALAMMRKFLGPRHHRVASFTADLANTLADGGDPSQAVPLHEAALALTIETLGEGHPTVAVRLADLGLALRAAGKLADAERTYRRALDLGRQVQPPSGLEVATTLSGLADVLAEAGQAAPAEPMAREALDIRKRLLPPGHPDAAESESVLGACLAAAGRMSEAEPLLRGSHAHLAARRGPRAGATRDAARRLARFYAAVGRSALAAEYRSLSVLPRERPAGGA